MATSFDAPKKNNTLHIWGNERTMNINHLILTNITTSNYFKNDLLKLKTFHEIVDEIYNQVAHLEPWEKGSRKLAGQTGMCGGVRGVGAGGIVSSAFTLLYKLFTLRLTRKQLNNLLNHPDSPYIRGLGFMYIRYCQEPADLWDWFEGYLDDEEEIDLKAGGGRAVKIGEMCQMMLSKLDWFGTLFPRIPIPIQKEIERKLREFTLNESFRKEKPEELDWGEAGRQSKFRSERYGSDDEEIRERPDSHRRSSRSHSHEFSSRRARSRSPRDRRRDRSRDKSPERSERNSRRGHSSSVDDSSSRHRYRYKSPSRSERQDRKRRHRSPSKDSEDRFRSRRHKHRQRKRREHSDSSEKEDCSKSHHKRSKDQNKGRSKNSDEESSSH